MKYTYETVGNSSYLAATFECGKGLINYQLQMLVNNEIKNVVNAAKKQKNDDIQIFYNITSKITLEQAMGKSKISKEGMIEIINGALTALSDIEEYQLVSSGIVFEPDKIFVKPGHFEPYFVYLPNTTEDVGIESLKNMLLGFVMGSKIEFSNDNFVQVLLETLNNPGFSTKTLRKMCGRYCGGKGVYKEKENKQTDRIPPAQTPLVQTPPVQTSPVQTSPVQTSPVQTPPENRPGQVPGGGAAKKPAVPQKSETKKKSENVAEPKTKNFKKTVFLILQAALAVIVGGLVAAGVLSDESGSINLQYVAGVLLAIGCIDFVVYREMFKNNKEKPARKEKEAKTVKKPSVAVPGKVPPAMPGKQPPETVQKKDIPNTPKKEEPVVSEVKSEIPQAAVVPSAVPEPSYDPISEFENEDTVVIGGNTSGCAYLEFYDNGIAGRVNLERERVVVGKLRSQCDFVLNNRKISKVHAEFAVRNGQYFVKDYNSTNGTYINGSNQRIQSNCEYQIFNGDRITLADVDMTFFC